MYRTFVVVHRWLALITAAFLVVIALSGCLLVLEEPISRAQQLRVAPLGEPLWLDTLAARARIVSGGGTVAAMSLGDSPDLAWYVSLRPSGDGRGGTRVAVDPYTGAVLTEPDTPDPAAAFIRTVHLLHTRLLGGNTGRTIVAITTIVAFILVLSGVLIWWREKLWRVSTRSSLAQVARTAVPGAAIMNMQLPSDPRPAMVQLKYPEDHTPAGRSRVFIDKHRGTVLLAMSTRTAEPGQHMIDVKRVLHTGDIYGWPTRLVWALACLDLAGQAVTGVLMWWSAKRRMV